MIKLLRANFARLFRNKIFQLALIITVGLNIFVVVTNYNQMQQYPEFYDLESVTDGEAFSDASDPDELVEYMKEVNSHESLMFTTPLMHIFIVPVIIGLFLGIEYSDGTIRNKLIVGHRRRDVYLANLITVIAGAEILLLSGMAVSYLAGLVAFKYSVLTAGEMFVFIIVAIFITASLASICTLFSMLITSKAGGTITGIILNFALMILALTCFEQLEEPRYYEANVYKDTKTGFVYYLSAELDEVSEDELVDNGLTSSDIKNLRKTDGEKNPLYVGGIKRVFYKWVVEATPGAQYQSLGSKDKKYNVKSIMWSSALIILTTSAGILGFRKRDLK